MYIYIYIYIHIYIYTGEPRVKGPTPCVVRGRVCVCSFIWHTWRCEYRSVVNSRVSISSFRFLMIEPSSSTVAVSSSEGLSSLSGRNGVMQGMARPVGAWRGFWNQ